MWFDFGRIEGLPSQFEAHKTPVTVDVLETGLIFAFVILAVSFYVAFIGLRGIQLLSVCTRITVTLILGALIIVGNYGQEWEIGHLKTKTPYRIGTGQEIEADISIKIGFRSVNVTLKADTPANTVLQKEVIDYNERFDWTWDQGRFGFGPYAGHLQQSFRAAQYKGLPLPILWVVDYFVFDGEGLRFGRFYRTAGWYSHICLWVAFASWILSIILFQSVIRFGVNFLAITGLLQLTSCLIWGVVRNVNELDIPFEDGSLVTKYGSSFYVTLIGGIICCILSIAIYICNAILPHETAEFFGIDPLSDYDEYHLTPLEASQLRKKTNRNNEQGEFIMNEMTNEDEESEIYDDVVILKRRTAVFGTSGRKRRTFKHMRQNDEEMPIYGNVAQLPIQNENVPLHPSTSRHDHSTAPILPPKLKR